MSFSIPLEALHDSFRAHLKEPRNQRIIFSGAFGIGKTFFIKEYFEKNSSKYVAVKLSPVNYSVSSNDDIFQLIKYDILFELIANHNLRLTATSINREVAYGVTLQDKLPAILDGIVGIVPALNKDLDAITTVWAALNGIIPFIKQVEEQRQDSELNSRLMEFVKNMGKLPPLESDYITSFIEKSLVELASEGKERVLIIDDLDRIDPEHIFRLFNIFSAHLDYDKGISNKFGFDKIIFVCDIKNIRNIFHNRYGAATDFNGYIDKFYSTEIFTFDNREQLYEIIKEVIGGIKAPVKLRVYFEDNILKNESSSLLAVLLSELIYAGKLSIRRLVAVYGVDYPFHSEYLELPGKFHRVSNWQITGVVVMQLLSFIIGGADALNAALIRLKEYENKSKRYYDNYSEVEGYLVGELLPIIGHKRHGFNVNTNSDAFSYTVGDKRIAYSLMTEGGRNQLYYAKVHIVDGIPYTNQDLSFFDIVYDAFQVIRKFGLFNE